MEGTSLLSSIEINKSGTRNNSRFLLVGPEKSGKSSLVMDFALSVATREPCRCTRVGLNIIESMCSEEINRVCCSCYAVTLFVPLHRDLDFPLLCEMEKSKSRTARSGENEKSRIWASKRIKIMRVNTARDVLSYLLNAVELTAEQQSFGGFIIEDIDVLCSRGDPSSSLIRMSQVGKLQRRTYRY
jgi:hypothetical protein